MRHAVSGPAAELLSVQPAGFRIQHGSGAVECGAVEYGWRFRGRWNSLAVDYAGPPAALAPGSHEEFIAEHYWGYCRQRDGSTVEYQVEHPPWSAWRAASARLDCDAEALYGPQFGKLLAQLPTTTFLADGSSVAVMKPMFLAGTKPGPGVR